MSPELQNLERCFDSVAEVVAELDDGGWATRSLCPAWTTKGVLQHLGGVEHCLTGWRADVAGDPPPFQRIAEYAAQTEPLSGSAMADRHRGVIATRRAEFPELADVLQRPILSPVGPSTYQRFMRLRVFDWWVHEQDVRRPLGMPGHEAGPAVEMAFTEIEIALGYVVGKKIGLPSGRSITFDLTGPFATAYHVVVDERAELVPELSGADVVVRADSTTFALLACGRIDPDEAVASGSISWSGDDDWGARAARNLRFTT